MDLSMALNKNADFQLCNENKVNGYLYEIFAFEDVFLRQNEAFTFNIKIGFNLSSDYIGLILSNHEKYEYLEFSQQQIYPIEREIMIDIKYTGPNAKQIMKNEKLGNLIVLKLSEEQDVDTEAEDS